MSWARTEAAVDAQPAALTRRTVARIEDRLYLAAHLVTTQASPENRRT